MTSERKHDAMGDPSDTDDPESLRIEQLLERVRGGEISDAETEELALYTKADPALTGRAEEAARQGDLGQGWLARVRADEALARREARPSTRIERIVALGFIALGYGLFLVSPAVGAGAMAAGAAGLVYSLIRARAAAPDPYKDVER